MNYELKENLEKITERLPLSKTVSAKLKKLNAFDFIRSCFFIDGKEVNDRVVFEIMSGNNVPEAAVETYDEVNVYKRLFSEMWSMLDADMNLDKKILIRLYAILRKQPSDRVSFRGSDFTAKNIRYQPPTFKEIERRLDALFVREFNRDFADDIIERAVFMHDGIVSIYPFPVKTEIVAYAAMQYQLLKRKFFIVPFTDPDYWESLYRDLSEKNLGGIYEKTVAAAVLKTEKIIRFIDMEEFK
jgi:Fic family protein